MKHLVMCLLILGTGLSTALGAPLEVACENVAKRDQALKIDRIKGLQYILSHIESSEFIVNVYFDCKSKSLSAEFQTLDNANGPIMLSPATLEFDKAKDVVSILLQGDNKNEKRSYELYLSTVETKKFGKKIAYSIDKLFGLKEAILTVGGTSSTVNEFTITIAQDLLFPYGVRINNKNVTNAALTYGKQYDYQAIFTELSKVSPQQ